MGCTSPLWFNSIGARDGAQHPEVQPTHLMAVLTLQQLSTEEIQDLLIEAVDTIRRYKAPPDGPARPKAFWPEAVKDFWGEYGRHRAKARLAPPDPEAIDRMDLFMLWLAVLVRLAKDRWEAALWIRILFSYSQGISFKVIAERTRYTPRPISKSTASRYYAECLKHLTNIANESLAA